jgi:hypothetical protein
MLEASRAAKLSLSICLVLTFFLLSLIGVSVYDYSPATAGSGGKALKIEKAYTLAGVIIDRARRVKRNQTDAEVKVTGQIKPMEHAGKSYDVVFLVRPSSVKEGKILTLTSGPVAGCRPFLKTFLTKTLSPKRINKAYKGAKLAIVDTDPMAKSVAAGWEKNRWLRDCSAKPKGKVDAFKVLIVNSSDA